MWGTAAPPHSSFNDHRQSFTMRTNPRNKMALAVTSACLFLLFILSLLNYSAKDPHPENNVPLDLVEDEKEEQAEAKIDRVMKKNCWKNSKRKHKPGLTAGFPIQYIHVPKAGGTTIQESIIPWANRRGYHTYLHNGDHDGVWKCPGMVDRGILMGHRGFGFCDRMQKKFGQNALYVVALREPVSRFRSLFDYFMENDYPIFAEYHNMWRGKELSDLVIEAQKILHMKLPASDPRMRGPIRFLELSRQQTNFMCGWDCVSLKSNLTMNVKLERALDNLRRTEVVVIMEKLDDMIDQLRYHTYLVPTEIKKFPMENTHKGKKSVLSEEAAKIVTEWSKRDIVLYEMAKARHEEITEHSRRCLASGELSEKAAKNGKSSRDEDEAEDDDDDDDDNTGEEVEDTSSRDD